ncbi:MAG TPA: hypothetical protein VGO00_08690 [Kofleriaceae bacterium]|nr:hypothetical protein [Kofleriaceae bacterium]
MRAEEKEVDDYELARETRFEEVGEKNQEALPALELATDLELAHRNELIGAIRAMFQGQTVQLTALGLPDRELIALDYLQSAVTGRDRRYHAFTYADDRRDMLEQALAVIEPVLATGAELAGLADITQRVSELRSHLSNLEDAQDELLVDEEVLAQSTIDTTDKPAPLDGPALPDKVPVPPSVYAPAIPDTVPPPTTLIGGPEVPDKKPIPTTVTGPAIPDVAKPKSTLFEGPEAQSVSKGVTSLVDPADPPKTKLPWWRKPFG